MKENIQKPSSFSLLLAITSRNEGGRGQNLIQKKNNHNCKISRITLNPKKPEILLEDIKEKKHQQIKAYCGIVIYNNKYVFGLHSVSGILKPLEFPK